MDLTVQRVLSQMTEHPAALDLPLDVRATAFQKRVWTALQQIPRGETRSYGEIAESLGQPTAAELWRGPAARILSRWSFPAIA